MKITNNYNLPETLVKAITWDIKPREGFSVTDLISPPRITQLQRRHWNELEEDVSERIWLLLGSAVHYILEKGEVPESLVEERLSVEIDGTQVRGHPDLWHNNKIRDYKITSVWTIIYQPKGRPEWHAQDNIYNYLFAKHGFETDELEITAILRDWQKRKRNEDGYPQIPVVSIPIPVWKLDNTEDYLRRLVHEHRRAEQYPDNELPLCTAEQRWERPTTYALMKEGRKSAVRVFDREEAAVVALKEAPPGCHILERPGEAVRCAEYCLVAPFCNQYKESNESK